MFTNNEIKERDPDVMQDIPRFQKISSHLEESPSFEKIGNS